MSERGSFVTEYIYCAACFGVVRAALCGDRHKYLCAGPVPTWIKGGDPFPIIAGKIGGLYSGEEIHSMQNYIREFSRELCHDVRIAVLAESGQEILTAHRGGEPLDLYAAGVRAGEAAALERLARDATSKRLGDDPEIAELRRLTEEAG